MNKPFHRKSLSFFRVWMLLLLILPTSLYGYGQITVSGVVKDSSNNEPIIGASVFIKGTGVGTSTDFEGKYSISAPNSSSILEFKYIGYKTVEYAASKVPGIILLKDELNELNEVVVVGYGTQKKGSITGAVDNINSDKVNLSFSTNAQNLLTGKLTGVNVIQNSGEPGRFNSSINVRGMGTPLIVIDGVTSNMDAFNRLSPSEIESVSVLKDASASVYGMKAGNGVLLVTTKSGTPSGKKPTIEYRGSFGLSTVINFNKPMNAYEYATMENEIRKYKLNPEGPLYSDEQMAVIRNTPGLDVYDEVMRKANPIQSHTVNISGSAGDEYEVKYYLTGNYVKEYGLFRSGDLSYDRYNLRSNVSSKLGYGLKATVNVSYVQDLKDEPYKQSWKEIWFLRPLDTQGNVLTSLYANNDPNHYLKLEKSDENPLASSRKDVTGYSNFVTKTFRSQVGLDWEVPFLKGLTARFMYTFEDYRYETKRWNKAYSLYSQGSLVESRFNEPSTLKKDFEGYQRNNIQASLNYSFNIFNDHNFKILALFEQNKYNNPGNFSGMRNFPMDALDEMPAGSTEKQVIGTSYPMIDSNQGFVGKLNYDYKGRYLVEGGFRYDGSSKFAKGKQWGFFPNASVGWRITEENFMRESEISNVVNNIKVRASYGVLGDDSGVYYNWANGYNYPVNYYIFGGQVIAGLENRGVTNPNLTWYTSKIADIGLDFTLWNGLLSGSFDVYTRRREGLLATRNGSAPTTSGATYPQENLNSDQTYGWEFMISHNNNIGDFIYSVSANINFARTKNLHVEQASAVNSYDNWRNNKNDRWNDIAWGHKVAGQITDPAQVQYLINHMKTSQMALAGPGDYYHYDLNGDGWVTEWEDLSPIFTNSAPKLTGGVTLTGAYKGFDLSLVFNGAALYTVSYEEFLRNPQVFGGQTGALASWTDRWHQDSNGNWIAGKNPRYREEWAYLPNVWDDSRRIKNAAYLRLKNIELGYSLPKSILNKIKAQNIRVYANAYNLLTFSNVKEMDPEYPGGGSYMYPMVQNYTFGINVTF